MQIRKSDGEIVVTKWSNVHGAKFPSVKSISERKRWMEQSKVQETTETKLKRIAEYSKQNPGCEYKWLMPHYNSEGLRSCFESLDGKKALGIDQRTKEEYGNHLDVNLANLIGRMKQMSYRPQPVREVLIPKLGKPGYTRPLGISTIEDKVVQSMTKKILESIYEPNFYGCSYGFRPKRGVHTAVKALHKHLFHNEVEVVIDVDLENFFGSISHEVLLDLLRMRIKDETFLRYIVRMLKAGVLSQGELKMTDEGTPHGSICSPVLSNIVAHYVIDEWFEDVVKKYVKGTVALFRYCDDLVICCRYETDAERVTNALEKRLAKYHLKMNREKTKSVGFSRRVQRSNKSQPAPFDFLGFTFFMGKSRNGKPVPKLKTSSRRLHQKVKLVSEWIKSHRSKVKLKPLWLTVCKKVQGHIGHYGVSFNERSVTLFVHFIRLSFFKWMNRRSQKRSMTWEKFEQFEKRYPLPRISIKHSLF
ncbi:MAG: group II intron reverse transcriptase/maturase [Pseudobdellovibrionaceae bacterium]